MKALNIFEVAKNNKAFRRILMSGNNSQFGVMSLKPDEEIEQGIFNVDKIFIVARGQGRVKIGKEEASLEEGSVVLIKSGKKHNLYNEAKEGDLKLIVIYAPAVYPDEPTHSKRDRAIVDPFSTHGGV
ncbi:MAG: cupin domain-containing protein [Patescibacteria group bacterium]|nr:cupin domain-containing protein [Patescibacteria group bacterium]